jgi:hypothetical protein
MRRSATGASTATVPEPSRSLQPSPPRWRAEGRYSGGGFSEGVEFGGVKRARGTETRRSCAKAVLVWYRRIAWLSRARSWALGEKDRCVTTLRECSVSNSVPSAIAETARAATAGIRTAWSPRRLRCWTTIGVSMRWSGSSRRMSVKRAASRSNALQAAQPPKWARIRLDSKSESSPSSSAETSARIRSHS